VCSTLSYSACPTFNLSSPSSDSQQIAADFDYALVGKRPSEGAPEWVSVADALDETHEGFDATRPEPYEWLEIWLLAPPTGAWAPAERSPWTPTARCTGSPGWRTGGEVQTRVGYCALVHNTCRLVPTEAE
jgi:hypothetical protein